MSDVSAIAGGATAMKQAELQTQVQVSLLKESLDTQMQIMQMLLESLGVGQNLNLEA